MAKKSRRTRRVEQRPRLSAAQLVRPGVDEAEGETRASVGPPAASGAPDLRSEYRYVISDLRRIGAIAAAMLAVLVVLAVVLA